MDLLFEAAQLPRDRRAAFLTNACGDDDDLKSEVQSLLEYAGDVADPFDDDMLREQCQRVGAAAGLRAPHSDTVTDGDGLHEPQTDRASHPNQLGPYKIVRLIGEGGMGCVYEAIQESPRRTVALKAIKPGIASQRLIARLRREANVLARLQHAGIAQVYDAGVVAVESPDGGTMEQPFFTMEFVDGVALDVYAASHALDDRGRLQLIAQVCDAVQHAHERGIVHRDLKFNNILVTHSGQTKVLDFGVSRITSAQENTLTVETVVGELLGTVPYMSPEQIEGKTDKLDARSDVYSLGVLCFELLAGKLPYDLSQSTLPEATRIIRFEEPMTMGSIHSRFRGDIQTFVAKALDKQPDRRYASAGEFAADIRRYLSAEPIAARPPTTMYQLSKFAQRNRGLVGGIIGMFVILLLGLTATSWFAWQAADQRDQAARERDTAQRESRRVAALNAFLVDDLFGSADPFQGGTYDRNVLDVITDAADNVDNAFVDDPDTEVSVREALGSILRSMGDYDRSEQQLRRALQICQDIYAPDAPELLETRRELAVTLWRKGALDEARELFERQLDTLESDPDASPDQIAVIVGRIGDVEYQRARYEEAASLYQEAREILESAGLTDDEHYVDALGDVANTLHNLGRMEEAIELHHQVLSMRTDLFGREHLDVATSMHNLGTVLLKHGDLEEAKSLLFDALDIRQQLIGDNHPDVADTLERLGQLLLEEGDVDGAMEYARTALAMQRELLPQYHSNIAFTLNLVAQVASAQGDYETNEKCHRESYEIYLRANGPDSRGVAVSLHNIAFSLRKQERYEEAIEIGRQAVSKSIVAYGEDHPSRYSIQAALGLCLARTGQFEEAEGLLLEAYDGLIRHRHPRAKETHKYLEDLYKSWGRQELLAELRANAPVD